LAKLQEVIISMDYTFIYKSKRIFVFSKKEIKDCIVIVREMTILVKKEISDKK
jgi:hypothetical protein